MEEYHKIPGPFKRDEDDPSWVIMWDWRTPELQALADVPIWYLTEKIDGTNVRVVWDGNRIEFRGKTNKANLPPRLVDRLNELFIEEMFEQVFNETPVTLYGEGFGSKIQGGGDYFPDSAEGQNEFALFDVKIDGLWLEYENVRAIAGSLGNIPLTIAYSTPGIALTEGIQLIQETVDDPLRSYWGQKPIEGFVAKTVPEFLDRRGHRIITKLKYNDFKKTREKT